MKLTDILDDPSVPEKFRGKTVGDLLQSYSGLETKLGGNPSPAPRAQGFTSVPLGGITQAPTQSPFDPFVEEVERNGVLSPESKAYLTSQGVPTRTIDIFEGGVQARAQATQAEIHTLVGGKDTYDKMIGWAASLPPTRQQAFNEALSSPNPEVRKLAVRGLQSEFVGANGNPPKSPVTPGGRAATTGGAFSNFQELVTAQKDPRYKENKEGYRDEVFARAAASQTQGVEGFV